MPTKPKGTEGRRSGSGGSPFSTAEKARDAVASALRPAPPASGGQGKGSWYSQFRGRHTWVDKEDDPWSAGLGKGGTSNVSGWATGRPGTPQGGRYGGKYTSVLPDWAQGVALPQQETLGKWYKVYPPPSSDAPGPRQPVVLQQTDTGPGVRTGRQIDFSSAAAEQLGYQPHGSGSKDITDKHFSWEPTDPPAAAQGIHDPVEQGIAVARSRGLDPPDVHRQQLAAQYQRGGQRATGFTGDASRSEGMGLSERQRAMHQVRQAYDRLQDHRQEMTAPVRASTQAPTPHLKPREDNVAKRRQSQIQHDDKIKQSRERHTGSTGGLN